ncbi:hypothetical protein KSP40_PGU020679 [Platanthera guangdongensis]|uniref:RlpA-like protein double-psi beta-barrel domain-containing protein n=1 Tax=Platanthera guangdongensis TaxID=2320717 RepID=A0ABR2ME31_9ASPA
MRNARNLSRRGFLRSAMPPLFHRRPFGAAFLAAVVCRSSAALPNKPEVYSRFRDCPERKRREEREMGDAKNDTKALFVWAFCNSVLGKRRRKEETSCFGEENKGNKVVRLSASTWDDIGAKCGKKLRVICMGPASPDQTKGCNPSSSTYVDVIVVDRCKNCKDGTIKLSKDAFMEIAHEEAHRVKVQYVWLVSSRCNGARWIRRCADPTKSVADFYRSRSHGVVLAVLIVGPTVRFDPIFKRNSLLLLRSPKKSSVVVPSRSPEYHLERAPSHPPPPQKSTALVFPISPLWRRRQGHRNTISIERAPSPV